MYPITYSMPLNRAKLSKNFLKTYSSNVSLIKIAFFFFLKLSQFRLITTNTSTLAFHLIYLNSSTSITRVLSCLWTRPAHVNMLYQHHLISMLLVANPPCAKHFMGWFTSFFVFQANSKSRVSLVIFSQVVHANPWNDLIISFWSYIENLTKIPWLSPFFFHSP